MLVLPVRTCSRSWRSSSLVIMARKGRVMVFPVPSPGSRCQYPGRSTQYSVPGTRYSILGTQYSVPRYLLLYTTCSGFAGHLQHPASFAKTIASWSRGLGLAAVLQDIEFAAAQA